MPAVLRKCNSSRNSLVHGGPQASLCQETACFAKRTLRGRIGQDPWHNYDGRQIARKLSHVHGDTLEEARNGNLISVFTALTEDGSAVNMVGDRPNKHDILTGTTLEGRSFSDDKDDTCNNWTSNNEGSAQVGHRDRTSSSSISWVSAHPTRGCSQADLKASGGAGLFYCCAID